MDSYVKTIEQALSERRAVREELQGQVHGVEVEIARLEGALDVLNGSTYPERTPKTRAPRAESASGGASNGASAPAKRTRQKNGYARSIAFEVLQATGEEGLHIRDLLSALEERDAAPKGASKRASLQSQLESDDRFERNQPATYRIRAGAAADTDGAADGDAED